MSSTRVELLNKMLYPLTALALLACTVPLSAKGELWLLRSLAIVITLAHVHYDVCVVRVL